MSDSVRPHRWQPTRLPCPWDSPGKNTGLGCYLLLQCTKAKSESEVTQLYLTLSDPMDCSPLGSSVHGIFQARILKWFAISFSRDNGWNYRLIFKGKKKNPSPCPFPHKLEDSMCFRPRVRNSLLLSARSIALDLNLCKMTWPDPCILTTFASLHPLSLEEISGCLLWHVLHPYFLPYPDGSLQSFTETSNSPTTRYF